MKLCGVKVQANALDSDAFALPVVCNYHFCADADFRARLGALNQGCGFVVFTARNLKFRPASVRFFTTHGKEFARRFHNHPIALFILMGLFGNFDEKVMRILFHHCHNHQKFERLRIFGFASNTFSLPSSRQIELYHNLTASMFHEIE